jgi:Uma2 family endonuclease
VTVDVKLMTADELLQLPRGAGRYELVRGELRSMSPAGFAHGTVTADLVTRLTTFVRERDLGITCAADTGFLLHRGPDTVRAPDVAFITAARLAATPSSLEGFFPGAPDLALEVVSPSDRYTEVEEKVAEWLDAGTRIVAVFDPRRKTARVYRPDAPAISLGVADTLTLPDLLPGWSLVLNEIFSSPRRP